MAKDVLSESLGALVQQLLEDITGGRTEPSRIAMDLHSVKSLLGHGNWRELQSRCHSLEENLGGDFSATLPHISDFLETVAREVHMPLSRDTHTHGDVLEVPPLLLPPPRTSMDSLGFMSRDQREAIQVLRILLDPEDGMPQARLALLIRRVEEVCVLIQIEVWVWNGSEAWRRIDKVGDPIDQEAVVYVRCLACGPHLEDAATTHFSMAGLTVVQVHPWVPRFTTGLATKNEDGLDLAYEGYLDIRNNATMVGNFLVGTVDAWERQVEAWGHYAQHVAEELDRSVSPVWIVEAPFTTNTILPTLDAGMVQILRNSIKHGFRSPAERTAAGKTPWGLFIGLFVATADRYTIILHDDGEGIDPKAFESTTDEVEGFLDLALRDRLSTRGFTFSTTMDIHGGRGMGLAAWDTMIRKQFWGDWTIHSRRGGGTTVSSWFPRNLFSLEVGIVSHCGKECAVPLAKLGALVETLKKYLTKGRDGTYKLTHGNQAMPIVDVWKSFQIDVPGLEELWPSDTLRCAVIVQGALAKKAFVYSEFLRTEICFLPLFSESVWSRITDTWIPLVDD